jgi:hypothetical protein
MVERFWVGVGGVLRNPPFDKVRVTAKTMRVGWGRFRGREADFSTALLTMKL